MKGTFIFVYDRGFVCCGEAEIDSELIHHWNLPRSKTIRNWGTTQGLAELKDGPINGKTVLDKVCARKIPFRSVIEMILLTEEGVEKWTKELGS